MNNCINSVRSKSVLSVLSRLSLLVFALVLSSATAMATDTNTDTKSASCTNTKAEVGCTEKCSKDECAKCGLFFDVYNASGECLYSNLTSAQVSELPEGNYTLRFKVLRPKQSPNQQN